MFVFLAINMFIAGAVNMKIKSAARNVGFLLTSCLVFLLFLEFVVFRFVLLPADLPRNAFVDGVIKYQANQSGVDRLGDDYAFPFRINADGWNSGHSGYLKPRTPDIERIAIIGDSYVEAFQVPFDQSLAERLEDKLVEAGRPTEVYRFGISGAPLSQYLHMLEREVLAYRPDKVAILLVHNDFDESFRFAAGRYTSSYRKLRIENGSVTGHVEPQAYRGAYEPLTQTASFRYLRLRQGLSLGPVRQFLLGGQTGQDYAANISIRSVLAERGNIEIAVDYVMQRFSDLAREHGVEIVLLMDADRGAIYGRAREDRIGGVLALNELARAAAERHGLGFIDLHPVFKDDYRRNRLQFEYKRDWHWNRHAHELAAETLARWASPVAKTARLEKQPFFKSPIPAELAGKH